MTQRYTTLDNQCLREGGSVWPVEEEEERHVMCVERNSLLHTVDVVIEKTQSFSGPSRPVCAVVD